MRRCPSLGARSSEPSATNFDFRSARSPRIVLRSLSSNWSRTRPHQSKNDSLADSCAGAFPFFSQALPHCNSGSFQDLPYRTWSRRSNRWCRSIIRGYLRPTSPRLSSLSNPQFIASQHGMPAFSRPINDPSCYSSNLYEIVCTHQSGIRDCRSSSPRIHQSRNESLLTHQGRWGQASVETSIQKGRRF